jgi:hypothetical protein
MGDLPSFYPPRPQAYVIRLPDRERDALKALRDEMWPERSLEDVLRKLVQDGLIQTGVLDLPKGNRGRNAGRRLR